MCTMKNPPDEVMAEKAKLAWLILFAAGGELGIKFCCWTKAGLVQAMVSATSTDVFMLTCLPSESQADWLLSALSWVSIAVPLPLQDLKS